MNEKKSLTEGRYPFWKSIKFKQAKQYIEKYSNLKKFNEDLRFLEIVYEGIKVSGNGLRFRKFLKLGEEEYLFSFYNPEKGGIVDYKLKKELKWERYNIWRIRDLDGNEIRPNLKDVDYDYVMDIMSMVDEIASLQDDSYFIQDIEFISENEYYVICLNKYYNEVNNYYVKNIEGYWHSFEGENYYEDFYYMEPYEQIQFDFD